MGRRNVSDRRVVITGLGVVAPGGVNAKAFWEAITSCRTATRLITAFYASVFRSRIAAEVDFDPVRAGLSHGEIRRLDRAAQFALVEPDPELDLDYVPLQAREQHLDTVLSVGSGFGGFQSAMVLGRPS
jgi:act minimal PKS ketosynthase (KS/KS alpha)